MHRINEIEIFNQYPKKDPQMLQNFRQNPACPTGTPVEAPTGVGLFLYLPKRKISVEPT